MSTQPAKLESLRDKLSDLVESPDYDPEELRRVAVDLLVELNRLDEQPKKKTPARTARGLPGTLWPGESHPSMYDALKFLKEIPASIKEQALEKFGGLAQKGSRPGIILRETLRRVMLGEEVSDRYALGLAWVMRDAPADTSSRFAGEVAGMVREYLENQKLTAYERALLRMKIDARIRLLDQLANAGDTTPSSKDNDV